MMSNMFFKISSSICYSIQKDLQDNCELSSSVNPNDTVRFVLGQYKCMPDYLHFPFRNLAFVVNFVIWLRTGSFVYSLPHEKRLKEIKALKSIPFKIAQDFFRFYDGLTTFYFYSKLYHN